ncbi:hypothetical protein BDZ94DRAFT_1269811 [Collybia nuda]|uniref:Protein-S-isoprenylcysteine O-methyltransferase n=1 Tax=Collybia nuda TaxID=64659 RepID=A0A9P6CAV5_9AGAR|nr:hypothetical protein BDZ94DRAFT_1269811 [Collybia nuda]
MSLLKLPLLVIDAISMRMNATPPNPPQPLSEHIIPDWRENFLKSLAWPSMALRAMYWLVGAIEVIVILASKIPSNPYSEYVLTVFIFNGASPHLLRITPLFLIGNVIGLFGTFLRLKCYRTLGRLFTFELCIQKDHRLVVDGPYAFIRHPSYTGLILSIAGYYCNHASGSWVRECGVMDTIAGKVMLSIWLSIAAAVVFSLLLRVPREDKILETRFGGEWLEWAQKVRYKLVPGIY